MFSQYVQTMKVRWSPSWRRKMATKIQMERKRISSLLALMEGKERWWCRHLYVVFLSPLPPACSGSIQRCLPGMLPRLGDGRLPPKKGALGLLSSPPLAIFKDLSLLKGYPMKLSHLHLLTFDPKKKKVVFDKSSRFPALLDNVYLPVSELRHRQEETERVAPWPGRVAHSFKTGGFRLALRVCKQNCRALPLKSKPVLASVLCFLYRMFTTCLFLLF